VEDENQRVRVGKVAPRKVAVLVAGVLAVGAVIALTGQNSPRPRGCLPQVAGKTPAGPASPPRAERIVACYFHRAARCPNCLRIEASVREAVELGFSEQVNDGRLEWRSVSYEEPGNEHYATDYKLTAPCLVLARMKGDKAAEWRSLPEVWELASDKPALIRLVQRNVQEFLDYIAMPGACCT
jgi:hypothetical protein